jgi:DNA-binding IclR family transcriptional regulator
MTKDPYLLQTLSNALDVLEVFEDHAEPMTISQLVEITKMNRTNLFRILYTLRKKGIIEVDAETGKYRLGLKLVQLSSLVLQRLEIKDIARPYLQRLRDKLNETVHLVVLGDDKIVFIDKHAVSGSILMNSFIGYVAPLYCTASGKLLLSFQDEAIIDRYIETTPFKPYTTNTLTDKNEFRQELKKIKKLGYSIDNEEIEEGLVGFATPIFSHGRVIASVSVSGTAQKMKNKQDEIIASLLETSKLISNDLSNAPEAGRIS